MGLFVWKWRVEKMWDWGQVIVLVSGGPSWEGFYVQLYKVVTTMVLFYNLLFLILYCTILV